MSDDLLAKMTRALSEEHDGATAVPEATRARIIRGLAERKPRRSRWLFVGVPAFALLGGGTAFAAATGNLPHIVERAVAVITGNTELEETPAPVVAIRGGGGSKAPPLPKSHESAAHDSVAKGDVPPPLEEIETPAGARLAEKDTEASRLPQSKGAEAEAKRVDPTLLAYRAAHEAHFKEGNCDKAIVGYREYLKQAPSGTFFLEAQYNLGVCLARAGRADEARAALSPFASGKYGSYRKTQATQILNALGQ